MKIDTSVALLQFITTLAVVLATIVAIVFGVLLPFDEHWPPFKIHLVVRLDSLFHSMACLYESKTS